MIFLKSLTFILWNMAIGTIIVLKVDWLLFNLKRRKFLGIHIPFTPGFVVSKREWVFNKARDILHDYLEQAEDKLRKNGYLAKWERLVRDTVYDKTNFVDEWMFLPRKWKDKIHDLIANSVKDIVSKILRRTVPHFVEQWRIEHRIDEFDEQFNAEFLRKYWRKYVLKYMLYAILAINFLIGITNLIWFLIIA